VNIHEDDVLLLRTVGRHPLLRKRFIIMTSSTVVRRAYSRPMGYIVIASFLTNRDNVSRAHSVHAECRCIDTARNDQIKRMIVELPRRNSNSCHYQHVFLCSIVAIAKCNIIVIFCPINRHSYGVWCNLDSRLSHAMHPC